MEKNPNIHFIV